MRTASGQDFHRTTPGRSARPNPPAPGVSGALEATAGPQRPATGLARTPGALVSIVRSLLLATLLVSIVPSAAADTWRVKESGVYANARTEPGEDYAIVETLPCGADVEELERVGDWSRVSTPGGIVAYRPFDSIFVSHSNPSQHRPRAGSPTTLQAQFRMGLGYDALGVRFASQPQGGRSDERWTILVPCNSGVRDAGGCVGVLGSGRGAVPHPVPTGSEQRTKPDRGARPGAEATRRAARYRCTCRSSLPMIQPCCR